MKDLEVVFIVDSMACMQSAALPDPISTRSERGVSPVSSVRYMRTFCLLVVE